jgi:hypothetical protein
MRLKRLPLEDFNRIAALTRLEPRACDMARSVLVDGRAQTDVAKDHGMTKQRVKLAVDAIGRAYFKSESPGSGLVNVELVLPESLSLALAGFVEKFNVSKNEQSRVRGLKQAVAALNVAKSSFG